MTNPDVFWQPELRGAGARLAQTLNAWGMVLERDGTKYHVHTEGRSDVALDPEWTKVRRGWGFWRVFMSLRDLRLWVNDLTPRKLAREVQDYQGIRDEDW